MPEDDAKKEQTETPEDKPLSGEPGKRDLEYGHAFGTPARPQQRWSTGVFRELLGRLAGRGAGAGRRRVGANSTEDRVKSTE